MNDRNPLLENATGSESVELSKFASELSFEDIPGNVVDRIVDLFVDWAGSALSGKGHRAISVLEAFAETMGPADGAAEILTNRQMTSPCLQLW